MSEYLRLLQATRGASAVGEAAGDPLPPELELQALWFAGGLGREFTDDRGRGVTIVQFGEWNRCAGPDFLHAVVEVDGVRHRGPVELDLHPADWEAHGHGADPAFEDTVLHVVFHHPAVATFTRTAAHREVPRVTITPEQLGAALQLPRQPTTIARPGRCIAPLARLPDEALEALLHEAAAHRARLKAGRFRRSAEAHGRDTALWFATAETLGYRRNALPMKLLAQRLHLAALREAGDELGALVFGAAGFLSPELHEQAPDDTREQLRRLWDHWWKLRGRWESAHPIAWRLAGQRPANHPHRRLAALVECVRHWPGLRRVALARPFDPAAVVRFLTRLEDPFWTHRHTLASGRSERPIALFGRSRALELLANHLIPVALQEDLPFADYLRLPGPGPNEKLRRCAIRLFGSAELARPWLRKLAHQQALLQVYHDFCLEDASDCRDCPFPEQLAQWRPPSAHPGAPPPPTRASPLRPPRRPFQADRRSSMADDG